MKKMFSQPHYLNIYFLRFYSFGEKKVFIFPAKYMFPSVKVVCPQRENI